jgi:hypothetical protein
MTRTESGSAARAATAIPEAPPLTMRVIVNRLPGTEGWRPGMAPTLELVLEQAPEDADR